MAAHRHIPSAFEGRPVQAPGMMRHGPPAVSTFAQRPIESLPPSQLLEKKVAVQTAEMESLVRENQRLAASHVKLRQELAFARQELQRVEADVGSIRTEGDVQIRGLLQKIGKMEDDIRAGEIAEKELRQAHMEAHSLVNAREELSKELGDVTDELQNASSYLKQLPELHAELDGLRQEHKKLRAAFEYEKGSNIQRVEQMRGLEKNLVSLAREVEKLRAEVYNAEQRANVPNHYGATYGNADLAHAPAGQVSGYTDQNYSQGSGYIASGYEQNVGYPGSGIGHGALANYPVTYLQTHMTSGTSTEGVNRHVGVSGAGYTDAYGRMLVPLAGGVVAAGGTNPHGGALVAINGTNLYAGIAAVDSYGTANAPQLPTQR